MNRRPAPHRNPATPDEVVAATLKAVRGGKLGMRDYLTWQEFGCDAWARCREPQAMLQLLARIDRRAAVAIAARLARIALPYTGGDARARLAVEATEGWLRGEVSDEALWAFSVGAQEGAEDADNDGETRRMNAISVAGIAAAIGVSPPFEADELAGGMAFMTARGSRFGNQSKMAALIREMAPCPALTP